MNHAILGQYNFLAYATTTFEPYTKETAYESYMALSTFGVHVAGAEEAMVQSEGGAYHVLRSLTLNSRKVFHLLASMQTKAKEEESDYIGNSTILR